MAAEDALECRRLAAMCTSPWLAAELRALAAVRDPATRVAALVEAGSIAANKNRHKVTSYAWDQTASSVKIYVSMEGIDASSAVQLLAFPDSITLVIDGLGGKDYALQFKTAKPIIPEQCTHKIKPGKVLITLKKEVKEDWGGLHKEDQEAADRIRQRQRDAVINDDKSITQILKEAYQTGNDHMKRMIGQAWTDAQDKKKKDAAAGAKVRTAVQTSFE